MSSISSFSFRLICHMISILMDACYTDLEEIQSITVLRKSSSDITRIESKYAPSSSFLFSLYRLNVTLVATFVAPIRNSNR